MKSLMVFIVGISLSLSVNVFAGGIADRSLESQNNGEEDIPSVRILREYSGNQSDTSNSDQQSVAEIDENKPLENSSGCDATVVPAEEIIKEYSKNNDDHKNEIDINNQHNKTSCYTSAENKLSSGCKTVAEEAKPKHALDENSQ